MAAAILLALLVIASTSPEKITRPLGFSKNGVFRIPNGSTILHLKGYTEIYDASGRLWLRIADERVGRVSTPYGPQKATRVYEIPSGSFIKGVSNSTVEVYDPSGNLILRVIDKDIAKEKTLMETPAFSGWIEDAYVNNYNSIDYFYAEWICPTDPVNNWIDDDVVYLFPGIQAPGAGEWSGRTTIIQPVLEHNQDGQWPGNPITGRAWIVDDNGNSYSSDPISVSVGDRIEGIMFWSGSQWSIVFRNTATGKSTTLTTDLQGITNQMLVTTLEGYNLETTSDLWGTTDFTNMQIKQNGQPITVSWTRWVSPEAKQQFSGLGVDILGSDHTRLRTGR